MGNLRVPVGLDISDADAAVGDVKDPKTFYAGAVPKKTGTIPTVALAAGSNAYPAGYHAGVGGGLDAVDTDLVTANIKNGITIFNVVGHTDVRNVSDADALAAEIRTGKTFYAVGGARKTGSGTKTLSSANETVAAGYYVATTLSAVDNDLAVGNIKSGVNIFGFVGTYDPALIDDIQGSAGTDLVANIVTSWERFREELAAGADLTLATKTQSYSAGSRAFAAGFTLAAVDDANEIKLRLFMAGVQVVETAYLPAGAVPDNYILTFIKAMSGSEECKLTVHNYDGSMARFYVPSGDTGAPIAAAIAIGSIKT